MSKNDFVNQADKNDRRNSGNHATTGTNRSRKVQSFAFPQDKFY